MLHSIWNTKGKIWKDSASAFVMEPWRGVSQQLTNGLGKAGQESGESSQQPGGEVWQELQTSSPAVTHVANTQLFNHSNSLLLSCSGIKEASWYCTQDFQFLESSRAKQDNYYSYYNWLDLSSHSIRKLLKHMKKLNVFPLWNAKLRSESNHPNLQHNDKYFHFKGK